MVELEGTVERITYYNKENCFTVAQLIERSNGDEITIIGYFPSIDIGQILKVKGKWELHKDYGHQLQVKFYETVVPATVNDIENYLASGAICGIGPVTAKKIVERFKENSLNIIETNPEELLNIEGIGPKKLDTIVKSYNKQQEARDVMVFIQSFGIGPGIATKIYKTYKDKAVEILRENPYKLADDVRGIGFRTADKIAMGTGIERTSIERLMAGLKYTLYRAAGNGHVFLPSTVLKANAAKLLNVDIELLDQALLALRESEDIIIDTTREKEDVYLVPFFVSEASVARRLLLLASLVEEDIKITEEDIHEIEKSSNVKLAEKQKKALQVAATSGVLVITGGPGTGKTTVIKSLIELFKKQKLKVALAAPTGRAAKRMAEATGKEAKTIHRLLEYKAYEGQGMAFGKNSDDPLDADVIIIDEVSMVDLVLMHHLLSALKPGARLILVGDKDQLPSVGAGSVLKDIIESEKIPTVTLDEIFRQAKESMIVVNAHRINKGFFPYLNVKNKDFYFEQVLKPRDILKTILDLAKIRLPKFADLDPIQDIQVISPMKKGIIGVINLNQKLQHILNPKSTKKKEIQYGSLTFREGDKVMQIKNNYEKEVFNGDLGYVKDIDPEEGEITVSYVEPFGENNVKYDTQELEELDLAYALSVHKSQGSEFPVVLMPLTNQHYIMLQRNLLYTAITRAEKLLVLVGTKQALSIAVQNNRSQRRFSHLSDRIVEEFSQLRV